MAVMVVVMREGMVTMMPKRLVPKKMSKVNNSHISAPTAKPEPLFLPVTSAILTLENLFNHSCIHYPFDAQEEQDCFLLEEEALRDRNRAVAVVGTELKGLHQRVSVRVCNQRGPLSAFAACGLAGRSVLYRNPVTC